jgi:acyl carrier protein
VDIKASVRKFITQNYYVADPAALADEASLLDLGIIDSTGVLELVAFLETTFEIEVADDELVPENLDSVANLEVYVNKKLGR